MMEFNDIGGFLAHMARVRASIEKTEHRAIEAGAEMIRDEAKAEIGHYQEEAGPFEAWQSLAEETQKDRVREGYPADDPLLREGDLRDSITCHAQGNEAAIGSNSDIAVWQFEGTEKIPARNALGAAAFRKAPAVAEQIGSRVVWTLRGLPTRND